MLKILRNIKFIYVFWVFFYFFLFCLLLRGSFNYLDPDFGWHLKVGQEIAQTGTVPHLNHYNYTFTGNWVDHEWLSNLLVYQLDSHFGYPAVVIFFVLVIILVLILLNIWAHRVIPERLTFNIAFFQFLGTVASLPHFGVRIQELGLLFLLLLLLIITQYNKNKNWLILLWLPPLLYLWACLHASFLIGFFLAGAWLAIKISEKIFIHFWGESWFNPTRLLKRKEIFIFAGSLVSSFVVTLFTPYKLELYSFLGKTYFQKTFYQNHIQEWLSQFYFPLNYWQLIYLAFLVMALILAVCYSRRHEKHQRLDLWALFLAVLFIFLSFKSRRHFPLMFVATFIFMIETFSLALKTPRSAGKTRFNIWLKLYLLICLFLVALFQLVQTRIVRDPFRSFCRTYPCRAVSFLQARPEYNSFNLLNDYGWGGYLIKNLPERKLFIDGRLPQITISDRTYLEEYYEFYKKDGAIAEKLKQYQIRLILMPVRDRDFKIKKWEKLFFGIKEEELGARNYLRDYLIASPDWQPIYYDGTAVVYFKKI